MVLNVSLHQTFLRNVAQCFNIFMPTKCPVRANEHQNNFSQLTVHHSQSMFHRNIWSVE